MTQPFTAYPLHLCICADSGFSEHIPTLFYSIGRHHAGEATIHFVDLDTSKEWRNMLIAEAERWGLSLRTYDIPASALSALPQLQTYANGCQGNPLAFYIRWYLPEILPEDIDRVIHLDADILVQSSLAQLPDFLPQGQAVAGVPDLIFAEAPEANFSSYFGPHMARLGLPQERNRMINTGVLVLSMHQWRQQDLAKKLLARRADLVSRGVPLLFQDQDVMNVALSDQIHRLPSGWNLLVNTLLPDHTWRTHSPAHAPIMHFAGREKPWHGHRWMHLPYEAAVAYAEARIASAGTREAADRWRIRLSHYERVAGSRWAPLSSIRIRLLQESLNQGGTEQGAGGEAGKEAQFFCSPSDSELQQPSCPSRNQEPPTACCLINNHNYGRYVGEAIESALAQTPSFDEIVVVDDGSTDESRDLLLKAYGSHPRIKLVFKPNGGQLSAFMAGLEESRSEIVFFLDADDRFLPGRLERTLKVFQLARLVQAVMVPVVFFGQREGLYFTRDQRGKLEERPAATLPEVDPRRLSECVDLSERTYYWDKSEWLGSPTSGIAVRRSMLDKFLPLPIRFLAEWRTRADDVIVFGLSMARAVVIYQHELLVEYRVHSDNAFFGRPDDAPDRKQRVEELLVALRQRLNPTEEDQEFMSRRVRWLWDNRASSSFRMFERLWRLPRKCNLSVCDRWRVRMALLGQILRNRASTSLPPRV